MASDPKMRPTPDLHLTTEFERAEDIPSLAKRIVYDWIYEGLGEGKAHPSFQIDEVYVVWFNFTLGNWKALISTTLPDGRYYEVTHRVNSDMVFIDTYKKTHNNVVNLIKE